MIRTRVGYAGGRQADPTYRRMGDHTESIQIDFDPTRIDYEGLLAVFWKSHNPSASRPRQYKSLIFYHDTAQQRLAVAARDREKVQRHQTILTEIVPFQHFYRAEDYHQKYYLRREKDLLRQLQKQYPNARDLIDTTTAARINGYLGGFGTPESLATQGNELGLSPEGRRRLHELFEWRQN